MKLAGDYEFEAPIAEVWKALLDPEVLASVMPGCDALELRDGVYYGDLQIKVGPVQGKFQGKVSLSEVREEQGYAIDIDGRGAPGFVKARARIELQALSDTRTALGYEADAQVGGRMASVGQRLIEASAKAIIGESLEGLHANVRARALAPQGEPPPRVEGPSQTEFAMKIAKEVLPPRVRWALVIAALFAAALLIYFLGRR